MNFVDSHEVSVDVLGDGKDIWTCKWSGGDKVQVFRGDFVNNRILFNHLLTLDANEEWGLKEFCNWAHDLLLGLVKQEYKEI
jgi:hypothetical protein